MSALLVGYARCSTDQQDLTAQRDGPARPGRRGRANLRRPRPDRYQPRASRSARSAGRMSGRRHPRGHQARPSGPIAARRPGDRRRAHQPADQPEPGRVGLRPHRRSRPAAVQRAGHGRRVRVRPDPVAHPRGHEGRQGQRAACGASSPSSTVARRRTWSRWCTAASTAPPKSPSSSVLAAPPSTAPSSASAARPVQESHRPQPRAEHDHVPVCPGWHTPAGHTGTHPKRLPPVAGRGSAYGTVERLRAVTQLPGGERRPTSSAISCSLRPRSLRSMTRLLTACSKESRYRAGSRAKRFVYNDTASRSAERAPSKLPSSVCRIPCEVSDRARFSRKKGCLSASSR